MIPLAATYRDAGVKIGAADQWLRRMRPLVARTRRPGVLADRGQFAGLFRMRALRLRDPVLVASADGVGTKLLLARRPEDYETLGIDLVAMNVNDVLVYGAAPVLFLDYLAVGALHPQRMTRVLSGIARGCQESGCVLLGGETAEMPDVYHAGAFDLAGFCVGAVERRRLLDGSRVQAGDAIVGLASSGVHANGVSLVRGALSKANLARLRPHVMVPTRIYVTPVLELLRRVRVHALAHVTGGGLARRVPSLVGRRPALRARLEAGTWTIPPIFRAIQRVGGVSKTEMFRTFNMGIGFALVCPAHETSTVIRIAASHRLPAWVIGRIERVRSR